MVGSSTTGTRWSGSGEAHARSEVEARRLRLEVERLQRECRRLEDDRRRLELQTWEADRARRAAESQLQSLRFTQEIRGWFLVIIVPCVAVTLVLLGGIAAR